MKWGRAVGFAVVFSIVVLSRSAHAADEDRAPTWTIRFESGAYLMPDHLHDYGLVGLPPPVYFGVGLECVIAGPWRANADAGVSLLLGWLVGGTVRYAAIDRERVNLSIGAGPLVAPDAAFGAAAFAQVDAALQLTIVGSFGVVFGGSVGLALNRVGEPSCGVDTCQPYLARGDAVESLRAGIGFAF